MKCHYVYDKIAGKVLIPECWAVVLSGDIRDCTCSAGEELTFAQFERERYNQELEKLSKSYELITSISDQN